MNIKRYEWIINGQFSLRRILDTFDCILNLNETTFKSSITDGLFRYLSYKQIYHLLCDHASLNNQRRKKKHYAIQQFANLCIFRSIRHHYMILEFDPTSPTYYVTLSFIYDHVIILLYERRLRMCADRHFIFWACRSSHIPHIRATIYYHPLLLS